MKKKQYESPEFRLLSLSVVDIINSSEISASPGTGGGNTGNEGEDDDLNRFKGTWGSGNF